MDISLKDLYNEVHRSKSDVICPKCEGSGLYDNNYKPNEKFFIAFECMYCDGEGVIDWIENIVGKKNPYQIKKIQMSIAEFNYRLKEGRYGIKTRRNYL